MRRSTWLRGFAMAMAMATLALQSPDANASLQFNIDDQEGSDSLATKVLVEQAAGGDLKFTVTIVDLINTGDLRGIFFHVANEGLLSGLSAVATGVGSILGSDQEYDANNVQNMGGGVNITPLGPFDVGIEIGTGNGAGGPDDLQTVMFLLSHDTLNLCLNTFFPTSAQVGGDFLMAIRAQTVGLVGSRREGSAKQGGGDPIIIPPPPQPLNEVPEPTTLLVWGLLGACAILGRANRSMIGRL